jgi:hypothetical protein
LSVSEPATDESAQGAIAPMSVSDPEEAEPSLMMLEPRSGSDPAEDEALAAASVPLSASTQEVNEPLVKTSFADPEEGDSTEAGRLNADNSGASRPPSAGNADALQQMAVEEQLRRMEMRQSRQERLRTDAESEPAGGTSGAGLIDNSGSVFGQSEGRDLFNTGGDCGSSDWADEFLNNLAGYDDPVDEDETIKIDPFAEEESPLAEDGDWLTGWLVGDDKLAK